MTKKNVIWTELWNLLTVPPLVDIETIWTEAVCFSSYTEHRDTEEPGDQSPNPG